MTVAKNATIILYGEKFNLSEIPTSSSISQISEQTSLALISGFGIDSLQFANS